MLRRVLPVLAVVLGCGTTPNNPAPDAATEGAAPTHVRIMAANISSGTMQSYEIYGVRVFQGLHPDIVLAQELNYPAGVRALVDQAFGTEFALFVEPSAQIPNAVISRWPIVSSGTWADASVSNRSFVWARIHGPWAMDVFAVSLHLLTTGATERDAEAKQLVGYVQANAPADAYLVMGGDLNTDTRTEPAVSDLSSVVVSSSPYPADQNGNDNTSINRNHPHDWLMANTALTARAVPLVIAGSTYAGGLVFDSRVYTPLADVTPVLVGDSAAPGMQHMPVVRDFMLP